MVDQALTVAPLVWLAARAAAPHPREAFDLIVRAATVVTVALSVYVRGWTGPRHVAGRPEGDDEYDLLSVAFTVTVGGVTQGVWRSRADAALPDEFEPFLAALRGGGKACLDLQPTRSIELDGDFVRFVAAEEYGPPIVLCAPREAARPALLLFADVWACADGV